MALPHADVRRILDILDHATHLDSLEVTVGDFVLRATKEGALTAGTPVPDARLMTGAARVPAPVSPVQNSDEPTGSNDIPEGMVAVRAPMVGTFYKRPQPDEPPFVEEGIWVEEGAPIALLEAMKLFNTIAAPVSGRVVRVAASDGKVVENDAVLVILDPKARA